MNKKVKIKKNRVELCIDDIKKVMKDHEHLNNDEILYINRWFLSKYIKPTDKVYY